MHVYVCEKESNSDVEHTVHAEQFSQKQTFSSRFQLDFLYISTHTLFGICLLYIALFLFLHYKIVGIKSQVISIVRKNVPHWSTLVFSKINDSLQLIVFLYCVKGCGLLCFHI